jgi:hypothetical protein
LLDIENDEHSVAAAQGRAQLDKAFESIDASYEQGEIPTNTTDTFIEDTERQVLRNRRRLGASAIIGAISGTAGAFAGEAINGASGGNHVAVMHHGGNHHVSQHPTHHRSHHSIHGSTGKEFYVEPGSGEIHEIQEYANAHHYSITPEQADQIYNDLYAEHGSKIINLIGSSPSTYVIHPGDVGLSHPGEAHWYPGIEAELRERLAKAAA